MGATLLEMRTGEAPRLVTAKVTEWGFMCVAGGAIEVPGQSYIIQVIGREKQFFRFKDGSKGRTIEVSALDIEAAANKCLNPISLAVSWEIEWVAYNGIKMHSRGPVPTVKMLYWCELL